MNTQKIEQGDVVLIKWKAILPHVSKMKRYDEMLGIVQFSGNDLVVECDGKEYWWHPDSITLISKGDFKQDKK